MEEITAHNDPVQTTTDEPPTQTKSSPTIQSPTQQSSPSQPTNVTATPSTPLGNTQVTDSPATDKNSGQTGSNNNPPPKKHFPFILIALVCLIVLILATGSLYIMTLSANKKPAQQLVTYFTYDEADKQSLSSLKTNEEITQEQIAVWTQKTFDLISSNQLNDVEASRILAYVTTAEHDAAYLSYNEKGAFVGSLDPVSKKVLCLFFKVDCADIEAAISDEYSERIASMVVEKIEERIKQDIIQTKPYTPKTGDLYWNAPGEKVGIDAGSRKPWNLKNGDQFRVSPPPAPDSPTWQEQLALTKKALAEITNEQREAVIFWAGGPGTKTPPGIWLNIAEEYMTDKETAIEKVLLVRAQLSQAMADAVIAVFDSKWTHSIRRPIMLDKTILTVMPVPNHPSYPAGHSTISAAAATVLSHYFPERSEKWEQLKTTAGISRIWGGIHFPLDDEAGIDLGTKVAIETLK